jgi:hypothetical protein
LLLLTEPCGAISLAPYMVFRLFITTLYYHKPQKESVISKIVAKQSPSAGPKGFAEDISIRYLGLSLCPDHRQTLIICAEFGKYTGKVFPHPQGKFLLRQLLAPPVELFAGCAALTVFLVKLGSNAVAGQQKACNPLSLIEAEPI